MGLSYNGGITVSGTFNTGTPPPPPVLTFNSWDTEWGDASVFTFTNENLTVTRTAGPTQARIIRSIDSVDSSKYYTEITVDILADDLVYGIITIDHQSDGVGSYPGNDPAGHGYGYKQNGFKFHLSIENYGTGFAAGDIMGMAFDLDNGAIWFSKNGVWETNNGAAVGLVSADIAAYNATAIAGAAFTGISGTYFASASHLLSGDKFTSNFGASAFNSTPPTGFIAWQI